jgi:predicted membrane protein
MELLLNLAWMLVAGMIVFQWLRGEDRDRADRGRQLVAITVLIAILFPVISVSDDLLAIQNASEADNFLRRDHLIPSHTHPVQPALTLMGALIFAGIGFGFVRFVAPSVRPVQEVAHPELASIDNRPPPIF